MELTTEQKTIINSLKELNNIKIFAFAGTGKTTTLKAIANSYPQARILYLAFNKSIEREAKGKFPRNVEVRTVHALAYKYIGRLYEIQNLNP
jgi:superfamily I DNA/RNA helicase